MVSDHKIMKEKLRLKEEREERERLTAVKVRKQEEKDV